VEHNIFAIELCLRLEDGNRLRAQLRELIVKHPAASTAGQKWELLKRATDRLLENMHLAVRGCWDFFDDDGRALRDYEMWFNGMKTEEGARKEPSRHPGDGDSSPRFMTFTIALLLVAGSQTARELERICDIPEDILWHRATFNKILRGLPKVSFASVKSDVIYLIPGEDRWGLTEQDLQQEKFEYLRQVV
jgi:hypothetical protein